ncbi:MAG: bifunctional folylpolyglutamate synthase/dihydrofolate synthase [Spirochaetales bacterium]|nr:bifunctional folylpolyglutamate synthase/dihydrofolate synthase [Spirochaetales bacterium]
MIEAFTTVQEGFLWMESLSNLEKSDRDKKRAYRLERMVELCRLFEDPQRACPVVHLAGSKGKGSTAAFLSFILAEKGEKTGLYTSPHLADYRERMQIIEKDGGARFAQEEILLAAMNRIRLKLEEAELSGGFPTTFELLTLLAFLVFREEECSFIILETGLGGRLDATNVCLPRLSIITPIEKEHTQFLGDTLEEIAGEKAGIIKENIPVLVSPQKEEVFTVLSKRAEEKKAPFYRVDDFIEDIRVTYSNRGTMEIRFSWRNNNTFLPEAECSLVGSVQAENAALAITAASLLFPQLSQNSIGRGLKRAALPGRSQILSTAPLIMLDGAHTPRSAKAAREAFLALSKSRSPRVLIFGCALDKDARGMAALLSDSFDRIIISRPGTFKESDPAGIARIFETFGPCELIEDSQAALESALKDIQKVGSLLVTGSFYLAGEIYHGLK